MSNSLGLDQAQCFVGPDLGPNYLQRLSADDRKSPLAGKELIVICFKFLFTITAREECES